MADVMICPLCGCPQPGDTNECVQCHTRLTGKPSGWRGDHNPAGEDTDAATRVERRRRPRPRERTVANERSGTRERPTQRPPERTHERPPERLPERPITREQRPPETKELSPPPFKETTPQRELPPRRDERTPPPGSSVTQLVDRLKQVVVTTTPDVQDRTVTEYKGVVTAGAVVKLEDWEDYAEGINEVGALRSAPFYERIRKGRDIAMTDMKIEAAKLGANGVVGVTLQFEQSRKDRQASLLIWIVASGTAVVLTEEGREP
jgi:uncharacterized protein YbjQ (UPF0145 family)